MAQMPHFTKPYFLWPCKYSRAMLTYQGLAIPLRIMISKLASFFTSVILVQSYVFHVYEHTHEKCYSVTKILM